MEFHVTGSGCRVSKRDPHRGSCCSAARYSAAVCAVARRYSYMHIQIAMISLFNNDFKGEIIVEKAKSLLFEYACTRTRSRVGNRIVGGNHNRKHYYSRSNSEEVFVFHQAELCRIHAYSISNDFAFSTMISPLKSLLESEIIVI